MNVEFTNTLALTLLGLIPAALYVARRSHADLTSWRSRLSLALRLAMLLLLVLSLAGLRLRTTSRDLALIFLIDVSASVPSDQQRGAIEYINSVIELAGPRDYIGVIAFAREPAVELAPTRKEILGDWRLPEIQSNPSHDYTDIAAALRLAAALVPETAVGRIILLSDGNENLESSLEQAQFLKAAGIQLYAREIENFSSRRSGEIAVRAIEAPQALSEGEAFELKVFVDSTEDASARLRIFRNDSLIAERDIQVAASGENVFVIPQRNDSKGFYTYRAEIEALTSDRFVQNNSRQAFSLVSGHPRTLYLHGDAQPSAGLVRVLAEGNFAADIRSAAGVPTSLAGFQNYDLIIFDNVPAATLTSEQMKMVQAYIRDLGGGFVMIGGDHSFGAGGYYKTPVEAALPVSLDVRQKKHFPSLGIVLVIDKSGSMAGPKMDMTIEAALATLDLLSERDSLGVIAFDSEPMPVSPLAIIEDKTSRRREISGIQAIGGTNMYPALKMAYEWLQSSDAQLKHVIVLSDGMSEPGDFSGIARLIRQADMSLTTVAVGDDSDIQTMRMLANIGGGRFYAAERPDTLPRIFTREAFLASQSTIIEEPFAPRVVRPSQATAGIDWTTAPQLRGYVGTAERDSITSAAITSMVTDKDDPLYAVWQYGLGRSAAFTSDAKPVWATEWMNWAGFGQFWTQTFRETVRREESNELMTNVAMAAGRGHITVDAIKPDGEFRNDLRLQAHVVAPDLSTTDIALSQTAAGRYEADFSAMGLGAYLVTVTEVGLGSPSVAGAVNSYSPEYEIRASGRDLLRRLTDLTGGGFVGSQWTAANGTVDDSISQGDPNSPAQKLLERNSSRTQPREIWAALLTFALVLLPLDVGMRRVHLTRDQLVWLWDRLSMIRKRRREPEGELSGSVSKLKGARARVRLTDMGGMESESKALADELRSYRRSDAPAHSPSNPSTERPTKPDPASESLASRLLEAKRRRTE